MMFKNNLLLFFYLVIASLIGCEGSHTEGPSNTTTTTNTDISEAVNQLKTGENEKRVIELFGQPDRKSDSPQGKDWHYESITVTSTGSKRKVKVRLTLKNGAVVAINKKTLPVK